MRPTTGFIHEPDPEHPGWHKWNMLDQERFNPQVMGKMLLRPEGEKSARLRMFPAKKHSNIIGTVHGGATVALVDIALFATTHVVTSADAAGAVTLDIECRFIGAGELGKPLDAVTEVLRETGRMIFMRGLVEQDGVLIAAYSGSIRKPTQRAS